MSVVGRSSISTYDGASAFWKSRRGFNGEKSLMEIPKIKIHSRFHQTAVGLGTSN